MPAAENDREIGVPLFKRARDFSSLADHGAGHERDTQTDRIARLFQDALLVVGGNRGIDQANLVTGPDQRCRDRQDAEWCGGLTACKRWKRRKRFFSSYPHSVVKAS